jgi:hypothetical protein
MALRPQTAREFASNLLGSLGLRGSDKTEMKIRRIYPAAGPYANKASRKKRGKR